MIAARIGAAGPHTVARPKTHPRKTTNATKTQVITIDLTRFLVICSHMVLCPPGLELHLDRFARGLLGSEVLAILKAEHGGDEARWELLAHGVVLQDGV